MSHYLLHDLAARLSTDGARGRSSSNSKLPQTPHKSHSLHKLKPDESLLAKRPWRNSPKYFTKVLISTVALVKMSVHAKLGGSIEIMGMLTGKVVRDTFIVMDVYSLPVEGTETRVNAQNEAYEYMVQYLDSLREVGNDDSIVGWYHSHPGYGCWLSGIDIATQSLNQNFQDPYLAIVIDPIKSANSSKVDIGAFRTFPVGYEGETRAQGDRKPRDLGAYSKDYYPLDVTLFKGPRDEVVIDSILHTSWVSVLLRSNTATKQYDDTISKKIEAMIASCRRTGSQQESKIFSATMRMFDTFVLRHDESSGPRRASNPDFSGLKNPEDSPYFEPCRKGRELHRRDLPFIDELEVSDKGEQEGSNDGDEDDDAAEDLRSRITESEEPSNYVSEDDMSCDGDSITFQPDQDMDKCDEELYSKGVKRNLHSSSEESKLEVFFDHTASGTRKRFASGEDGGVAENDLKQKLRMLELELKQQHRELSSVAHAELMKVIANRASQKIFGRQK